MPITGKKEDNAYLTPPHLKVKTCGVAALSFPTFLCST